MPNEIMGVRREIQPDIEIPRDFARGISVSA